MSYSCLTTLLSNGISASLLTVTLVGCGGAASTGDSSTCERRSAQSQSGQAEAGQSESVTPQAETSEPTGAEQAHGSTLDERIAAMAEMLDLEDSQSERLREVMARLHAESGTEGRHPHGGGPRAAEFRAALEEILTAEQLAQFDAHIEEVRQPQ